MSVFKNLTEIDGVFYKTNNAGVPVERVYLKNNAGTSVVVWEPNGTSSSASTEDVIITDPAPDLPPDIELFSIYGVTLNVDQISSHEQSAGTTTERINRFMNIIGSRCASSHIPICERDDSSTALAMGVAFTTPSWFTTWSSHPTAANQFFVAHNQFANCAGLPGASAGTSAVQSTFSAAQTETALATYLNNIKWNVYARCVNTTFRSKTKIFLFQNEPENTGIGSGISGVVAADAVVRDFPAAERTTATGITLALKRWIIHAKAVYEQLHDISQLANTNLADPGIYYFGPTFAFSTRTNMSGNQRWTVEQFFTTFNGLALSYLDGITTHMHRVQTTIESYTNQPPADNSQSFYHVWKIVEEANVLRVANGMAARNLPMMTDESGLLINSPGGWETTDSPAAYEWDGFTFSEGQMQWRKYRAGNMVIACMWYGLMLWIDYVFAYSGAGQYYMWKPDQDDTWPVSAGGDGLGMEPFADWVDHHDIWNINNYDINTFTQGSFPVKTWQEYHLTYSWGAWLPMGSAAGDTYASGRPPYLGWENITFSGGMVTMTNLRAASRNLICRGVALRKPDRQHVCSVEINFPTSNASARAKFRVRGYNKLNGLAETAVEVIGNNTLATGSNWYTAEVTIDHTGHGLANLNPANYLLMCCDHNNVGTVRFRNPRIRAI